MECRITKEDVFEFLKAGGKFLGDLVLKIYGDSLNQIGEKAFSEAIEIGIENTIAALYEANVNDKEILHIVSEQWGISVQEAEDHLVFEKHQSAIRTLRQYLKLQGYSKLDIDSFMRENKASMKIRHEKDFWKLKDNPEKLYKAIKTTK